MRGRLPRLAEWLIRWRLGPAAAEPILGDLTEQWLAGPAHGSARSPVRSSAWLAREVLTVLRPRVARDLHRSARFQSPRQLGGFAVLLHDLRYALRAIRSAPGLAAMTVFTLAFGIAGTTTVFSAVDGLVFRPFPFPDPDRLVGIGSAHPKVGAELTFFEHLSPAEYRDLAASPSLREVVAWDMGNRQVTFGERAENLFTGFWWGDAFRTLEVRPFLGRGFTEAEIVGQERVAVLSHRVWRDRFGADSAIVGQRVRINEEPYQVVGVMPPRTLLFGTDLWIPFPARPEVFPRNRRMLQVIARLGPGVTIARANAELAVLAARTEREHEAAMPEYDGWRLEAKTWSEANVAMFRPAALVAIGAISFVMLLVCANVATLLLGRSAARTREIALRTALGASRARVFRQLVTESLVLSLIGAGAGVGLGLLGIAGVNRIVGSLPMQPFEALGLNGPVLVAAIAVALLAGLVFGTIPAVHALRADLRGALHGTGTGTGRSRLGLQRFLIGTEAALALTLLAGSGYLLRTFARLRAVDPGFQPERVLTMRLTLARERYRPEAIEPFFATLRERVAALPGIRGVATASQFPPAVFGRREFRIEGDPEKAEGSRPAAYTTIASPEYFATLGVGLLRGRLYDETARLGMPLQVVVNEEVVRRYFPGGDPIGRRVRVGAAEDPWAEVVGVVRSTRNRGLDTEAAPEMFVSSLQVPGWNNQMFLLVRTQDDPRAALGAVRGAVRSLDPDQPVYAVRTIEEAFRSGQLGRRLSATLFLILGGFALGLAAIGLYGVVSYLTAQRTREIGVRVALGAARSSVTRLLIRQAMAPVAIGIGVGLLAAWGIGRAMTALLFEVRAGDAVALGGATLVLGAAGLLASYLPAARASRLDPVITLRQE